MPFPEKATASITSIDTTNGLITGKDSASGRVFQFKLTNPLLLQSLTVGQAFFVDIGNKLVSFDGSRINGNIVSIGPVDAGKPLGPVDGVRPLGPVDGAKPLGPVDGAKPLGPVDGAKPAGPVDGAKPAGPVDGVKPGQGKGTAFGPIDGATSTPGGGGKNFGPIDGATSGTPNCAITSIDASRGLVTARDNETGRTFQFRLSNANLVQALKPGQAVSANFASHQVSLTLNGQLISGSIVGAGQAATQK